MTKLFTQAALQGRSVSELRALFASTQQELVRSTAGSQERSTALRNLETISLAIARKHAGPRL
jgi:hypothetical protein